MVQREHCRHEEEYTGSPPLPRRTSCVSGNFGRCTVMPPVASVSMITSGWCGKKGVGEERPFLPL